MPPLGCKLLEFPPPSPPFHGHVILTAFRLNREQQLGGGLRGVHRYSSETAGDGRSDGQLAHLPSIDREIGGFYGSAPGLRAAQPFVAEKSEATSSKQLPFFAVMANRTNSLQSE